MTSQSNVGWIPRLTGLRMVVVLLIIVGHISTLPLGMDQKEYLYFMGYNPSWIGIQLLFMISGFLTMKSLMAHGSPLRLFQTRIRRNMPTLIAYAALAVFVIFPWLGSVPAGETIIAKFSEYAFRVISCIDPSAKLPGVFEEALYKCDIQGALWTFRWGIIAYIATALLWRIKFFARKSNVLWLAVIMTVGYMISIEIATAKQWTQFDQVLAGWRLGYAFVIGLAVYTYRHQIPRNAILALSLVLLPIALQLVPRTAINEITIELWWGYCMLCVIGHQTDQTRLHSRLPDLALGLYVFHWPIAQSVLYLRPDSTPTSLIAISLPITIGLAYVTWWAFQRPMDKDCSITPTPQTA